jgi:hypothetical protein
MQPNNNRYYCALVPWPKCNSLQGSKGYEGPKNLFKFLKRHDFPKNPNCEKIILQLLYERANNMANRKFTMHFPYYVK